MFWRRSLEWRAGWFTDPVNRLKFLRRSLNDSPDLEASRRREWVRPWRRASVVVITLLAALADTGATALQPGGNGLRFEEQYAAFTQPRRHRAFVRAQSRSWRRAGEGLLEYVRRSHSCHLVIDRFGRIFRVVRESDFANHAGNSVWAAFEARTPGSGGELAVNAAQIYTGRVLPQMLRARYDIPAPNPANYGVGYHLNWTANVPFAELGLAGNYKLPLGRSRGKLQKRYRDAIQALRGKGAYQEYN